MIQERLFLPELIDGPRGDFLRVVAAAATQLLVEPDVEAALNTASALPRRVDRIPGGGVTPCCLNVAFGSFPAVPARQWHGRSTPISGPPNSSKLT